MSSGGAQTLITGGGTDPHVEAGGAQTLMLGLGGTDPSLWAVGGAQTLIMRLGAQTPMWEGH